MIINKIESKLSEVNGDNNSRRTQQILFHNRSKLAENLPSSDINPMSYITPSSQVVNFRNVTFREVKNEISKKDKICTSWQTFY